MPFCYIEDIGRYVGQEVTLKGWLYNKRSSGKIHFLLVRDGSGVIQLRDLRSHAQSNLLMPADYGSEIQADAKLAPVDRHLLISLRNGNGELAARKKRGRLSGNRHEIGLRQNLEQSVIRHRP